MSEQCCSEIGIFGQPARIAKSSFYTSTIRFIRVLTFFFDAMLCFSMLMLFYARLCYSSLQYPCALLYASCMHYVCMHYYATTTTTEDGGM